MLTSANQDTDDLDVVSMTVVSPLHGPGSAATRRTVKCATCSKEFGRSSIR